MLFSRNNVHYWASRLKGYFAEGSPGEKIETHNLYDHE